MGTGAIPESVVELLLRLEKFNFSANSFDNVPSDTVLGAFIYEFKNLKDRTQIDLSGLDLSGAIPSSVNYMPRLKECHFQGNDLSGELPVAIIRLIQISRTDPRSARVDLTGNVTFTLPRDLSLLGPMAGPDFDVVTVLDMSNSNLIGEIPWLALTTQCTQLETLILQHKKRILQNNAFDASELPHTLGNLQQLTKLQMPNCNLFGSLPRSLSALVNLRTFDVSKNSGLLVAEDDLRQLQEQIPSCRFVSAKDYVEGQISAESRLKGAVGKIQVALALQSADADSVGAPSGGNRADVQGALGQLLARLGE